MNNNGTTKNKRLTEEQIRKQFGGMPEETPTPIPTQPEPEPEPKPELSKEQKETVQKTIINYRNGEYGLADVKGVLLPLGYTEQQITDLLESTQPDKETSKAKNFQLIEAVTNFNDKENTRTQKELIEVLEENLSLFSVDTKSKEGLKYYCETGNTYKEITRKWLKDYIRKETGIKLTVSSKSLLNVLDRIDIETEFNEDYLELDNVFLNMDTKEVIPKENTNIKTKKQLYLTINGEKKLLHYDPTITFNKLNAETNKTFDLLQQVTIPKYAPEDTKLFNFVIELLAFALMGQNPAKIVPFFYSKKSGAGKSTVTKLFKTILEGLYKTPDVERLGNENFRYVTIKDANIIVFDELEAHSFDKLGIAFLKRISGNIGKQRFRRLGEETEIVIKRVPLTLSNGNYIPEFNLSDIAFIDRLIIILFPNLFVDNPTAPNHYPKLDTKPDEIFQTDYKGLSEIVSLAINRMLEFDFNSSLRNQLSYQQTIEETASIIAKENPVDGFLNLKVRKGNPNPRKQDWLTLDTLITEFASWYRINYNNAPEKELLEDKAKWGAKLKTFFNFKPEDKSSFSPVTYNLRILSNTELIEHQQKPIYPDPNFIEVDKLSNYTLEIYKKIRDNPECNTIEHLVNEFPSLNTQDIEEHLSILEDIGALR